MSAAPALRLVAALDRARGIGRGNELPWRLPDDLQRFKALTLGKPLLMGRRTAEPLGRALPGRRNLVLTRGAPVEGAETVRSLEEALALCKGAPELCVMGGAEVYALALPSASRLELTEFDAEFAQADCWFPDWLAQPAEAPAWQAAPADWQQSASGLRFRFLSFSRAAAGAAL